jgi:Lon protease (S16) C-terminal proteolytic domain
VVLPRENEHDLEELPPETRDALRFVLVDSIAEVFDAAFDAAFDSNDPAEDAPGKNGRARATTARIERRLHTPNERIGT